MKQYHYEEKCKECNLIARATVNTAKEAECTRKCTICGNKMFLLGILCTGWSDWYYKKNQPKLF